MLVHWYDIEDSSGWDFEDIEDKNKVFVFPTVGIWRGTNKMRAFVTDTRSHPDYEAHGRDLNFPLGTILKVEVLRAAAPRPYYVDGEKYDITLAAEYKGGKE